ncbi:MAG: amidohydrolase family protein [Actinomycetota bacterium]
MLIRNTLVLDGSGEPGRVGDVRIDGELVTEVGPDLSIHPDETVLDGDGLAVAPGFVDLHSHSDLWSVVPDADGVPIGDTPKLLQGCTTQVFGQDGISAAPIAPDDDDFRGFQAGLNGRLPAEHWSWHSFADYLAAVRARSVTRTASLVGHATIRRYVMGMARRAPTAAEIDEMRSAVAAALDAGACGFSTGLVYVPAAYATTDEVHALAEVVVDRDLPFFVHVRSESDQVVEASEEVIGVAAATGCQLHYSHIKCAGRTNWPKAAELLDLIEAAHDDGVRISADIHPYIAGSTTASILLPPWAHEGGREAMLHRLHDATVRARLRQEMLFDTTSWDNWWVFSDGWDGLNIAQAERPGVVGRFLRDVLRDAGHDDLSSPGAFDEFFDLLIDERLEMTIVSYNNVEENVVRFFAQPWCSVGTDGVVAPDGHPHPRLYGTFPRVLGRFVREFGAVSLEDAVRKCAAQAADVIRAPELGRLRPGAPADLVLFDPDRIIDRATFESPRLTPLGIEAVWLAGRRVVDGGQVVPAATQPIG